MKFVEVSNIAQGFFSFVALQQCGNGADMSLNLCLFISIHEHSPDYNLMALHTIKPFSRKLLSISACCITGMHPLDLHSQFTDVKEQIYKRNLIHVGTPARS
jgi:hypothetical protein